MQTPELSKLNRLPLLLIVKSSKARDIIILSLQVIKVKLKEVNQLALNHATRDIHRIQIPSDLTPKPCTWLKTSPQITSAQDPRGLSNLRCSCYTLLKVISVWKAKYLVLWRDYQQPAMYGLFLSGLVPHTPIPRQLSDSPLTSQIFIWTIYR